MARENAANKGRTYLTEGRLILTDVRPGRVAGTCRGDGAIYRLGFDGAWHCTCPARSDQCAHLIAARLVTAPDLEEHAR